MATKTNAVVKLLRHREFYRSYHVFSYTKPFNFEETFDVSFFLFVNMRH